MADNLHSSDYSGRIYKHSGFTSTILNSFLSVIGPSLSDMSYDGTNSSNIDVTSDKLYRMMGFTTTVSSSFSSPTTAPGGLTWENFTDRTGGGGGGFTTGMGMSGFFGGA